MSTKSSGRTKRLLLSASFLAHFAFGYRYHLDEYGEPIGHFVNLWICSISLVLASAGTSLNRLDWLGYALVAVSVGHTAWMIDTIFIINTAFTPLGTGAASVGPLGIASYRSLESKSNWSWRSVFAASHHLWFMPLSARVLRGAPSFSLGTRHFLGGAAWVAAVSAVTLCTLPTQCEPVVLKSGRKVCSLPNVNMAQGWWGLDNVPFLHALDHLAKGRSRWLYFFYANVMYSGLMNGVCYFILRLAVNSKRKELQMKWHAS